MKVVLYQPQIPQNTGNIVRTCAVTGADLVLVGPLGFSISDRWLKRAGLDYWEGVSMDVIDDFEAFLEAHQECYFFSSHATISYTSVTYSKNAVLVYGSETSGLPKHITEKYAERCVTIPMRDGVRCLNLATSVGIGVYEVIRQNSDLLLK